MCITGAGGNYALAGRCYPFSGSVIDAMIGQDARTTRSFDCKRPGGREFRRKKPGLIWTRASTLIIECMYSTARDYEAKIYLYLYIRGRRTG